MSLAKVSCPECGASIKAAEGFEVGEEVTCPKCDTAFAVPKPKAKAAVAEGDDEPAENPKTKKKKAAGEGEPRAYKDSPLRYAILGALVLVMVVLGVMLYLKKGVVE
jgi:DNA-directed RNA polymerase subunit M/transcription elongation factor TFIIS